MELLVGGLSTPNALFYVRNHLPVPAIKPDEYRLRVEGEGLRTVRCRRRSSAAAPATAAISCWRAGVYMKTCTCMLPALHAPPSCTALTSRHPSPRPALPGPPTPPATRSWT